VSQIASIRFVFERERREAADPAKKEQKAPE